MNAQKPLTANQIIAEPLVNAAARLVESLTLPASIPKIGSKIIKFEIPDVT